MRAKRINSRQHSRNKDLAVIWTVYGLAMLRYSGHVRFCSTQVGRPKGHERLSDFRTAKQKSPCTSVH